MATAGDRAGTEELRARPGTRRTDRLFRGTFIVAAVLVQVVWLVLVVYLVFRFFA